MGIRSLKIIHDFEARNFLIVKAEEGTIIALLQRSTAKQSFSTTQLYRKITASKMRSYFLRDPGM
jgi:hypothetical protein